MKPTYANTFALALSLAVCLGIAAIVLSIMLESMPGAVNNMRCVQTQGMQCEQGAAQKP
jgi:hypothetical protein